MKAKEFLKTLESLSPKCDPKVTEFPSGAFMIDLTLRDVCYTAEYLPSFKKYGLSKTKSAVYGWEGVDEAFSTPQELGKRIKEILESH